MVSQNTGERMRPSEYLLLHMHIDSDLTHTQYCLFSSAIDPEEKNTIKSALLLDSFTEPVPQIAIQMAVLIGNISRFDYPQEWADVSSRTMGQSKLLTMCGEW